MSFDYDKIKSKEEDGGHWWVAYSDLFLTLSLVFLQLYVTASLKSGTMGLQKNLEYQQLSQRTQELEEQIKVYNTLKDEQLQGKNEAEQLVYKQLMDKLTLLKDDAKDEKNRLRIQAKENEQKEFALNQYQQIIRNIIDANVLAKAQIQTREKIIVGKNQVINAKQVKIQDLSQKVDSREKVIAENETKISQINQALEGKISQLNRLQKHSKMTKQQLKVAILKLKKESQTKISELESKNQNVAQELASVKGDLNQTSQKLNQAQGTIEQQENQKSQLEGQLSASKQAYAAQMQGLKNKHNKDLADARAAFNRDLASQNLSAKQRAAKLSAFKEESDRKARLLEGQLAGLNSKYQSTEAQLRDSEGAKNRAIASLAGAKKENEEMSGDLKRLKELAFARKNLSQQIENNFKKAGIKADVDEKTGDVTLAFGDDYFETGSANLTTSMASKLNRSIPTYAKSLFQDPNLAKKIANVEIIGFASSTYKGRYVSPDSMKAADQEAANYNLKLSFSRANSIFRHIFDQKKMQYPHQGELFPIVKVVGRGFLPDGKSAKDIPDGITEKEFCHRFNCKKAQRVIIKFNLKD